MDVPPTTTGVQERKRFFRSLSLAEVARRADVRMAVLWLSLAAGLAVLTTRVVDWYVMTDELLYERLAISVAQSHSPLPQIHGELIGNVNQLYPLLLAPLFHNVLVPSGLQDAHLLNAIVMSSAGVPAFLLARRVTQSVRLSYVVAALTICVPWIVLSSFLMTEVVAYPAFLWAVLLLQQAAVSPRPHNDIALLLALGIATFARTQFAVFLVVVPVALFFHQLAFTEARSWVARVRGAARGLVSGHRVLAVTFAVLAVVAAALLIAGRLSSVLGTYSVTAEGNLVPSGTGRSLLEHFALLGLGLGILPFVLGIAWLVTALVGARVRERQAFASIAVVTIAAFLFEVTSYDLRFGQGRLHDRYLFYVGPLVLIGFVALLQDGRWLRWSVFVSAGVLALAFAYVPVARYDKLNVDSPITALNGTLLDLGGSVNGARLVLAFLTIVAVALLVLGAVFLRRRQLVAVLLVMAFLAIPAQTALAFTRLLTVDGTSGRPITNDQSVVFDWIDRDLGPTAKVTMVPYPFLYGNYWENVAYWWNVEFWNASVQRAAVYEGAFTGTPETFPTTELSFDRGSGRANVSPSDYSAQAIAETRFRLAGKQLDDARGVALIQNEKPWRADWLAFDLYRDGWTIPKLRGKIRVFAEPGQTGRLRRFLTISVRGPQGVPPRGFRVTSNEANWQALADERGTSNQVSLCVPPGSYADVEITAPRFSPIYGDPKSEPSFGSYARSGGVLVTGIALADETAPC
jgi:hypothetical protein